ncbi:MAG: hypothetical protein DWQ02_21175 [Bacteroidetes bacterium]|nr:MAG: hypothetical protein DWQ02_21175 [Bacteroidota bacterium]
MEFFVTKIVDQPVETKVNLVEIKELLASLKLHKKFKDFEKMIVTFVVREPDDFEFDTWTRKGKVYLTIPLPFEEIMNLENDKVSKTCITLFKNHIKKLKLD